MHTGLPEKGGVQGLGPIRRCQDKDAEAAKGGVLFHPAIPTACMKTYFRPSGACQDSGTLGPCFQSSSSRRLAWQHSGRPSRRAAG